MKRICLLAIVLLTPIGASAQNKSETPLTFKSDPIRLNTRSFFASKKTERASSTVASKTTANKEDKKEEAKVAPSLSKPPTDWRSSGEYRMADHYVSNDWQKINNTFTLGVNGSQCRIYMPQTARPGLYVTNLPFDFKQADFTIEVVIEERASLPLAGLVYGLSDKDNYYSFLINPRGEYQVDGILEGESLGLMPRFAKSPAIHLKGSNTLQIEKKGNQVQYLINGQKVYENRFINFADNKIGYYVQSPEVSFRDFSVSLLKK